MAVSIVAVAVAVIVGGIGAGSNIMVMTVSVVMGGVGASYFMALTLTGCMGVRRMGMRVIMRLLQLLLVTDTEQNIFHHQYICMHG